MDVITLAAPKLRYQNGMGNNGRPRQNTKVTDKELLAIHEKRMRRFLDVAQAMKNILPDYLYDFKAIEFAVYCSANDNTNYKVFERILKPFILQV